MSSFWVRIGVMSGRRGFRRWLMQEGIPFREDKSLLDSLFTFPGASFHQEARIYTAIKNYKRQMSK